MGLTDCYTLEGRSLPASQVENEGLCIFCGEMVKHVNDGGEGVIILSKVRGESKYFMRHDSPCPPLAKAVENEKDDTPEKDRVIIRCGCVTDYVESVGDVCGECGASRDALVPVMP